MMSIYFKKQKFEDKRGSIHSSKMRKFEQCGVVLVNTTMSKLLIVLQKQSMQWGLPKGHMSHEEIIESRYFECAKRELYEETGVWLSAIKNKTLGSLVLNDKFFYVVQIFQDSVWTNPVDKNEILKTSWISISDIKNFIQENDCNSTLCKLSRSIARSTFPTNMFTVS